MFFNTSSQVFDKMLFNPFFQTVKIPVSYGKEDGLRLWARRKGITEK